MDIPKGVSTWILSKNRTFSYRCFSQKLCQKRSFFDILDRKQSFLDQKIEVLTMAKKWTFYKGVSCPWILSKNRTFSYRCFSQKLFHKRSFSIFWIEINHFQTLRRAKKWTFFKGVSPWILSKNRTFSYRCFSQKLCQKRSFFDILDRKQSFLDQKIEVLTRAKMDIFQRGYSLDFVLKWEFFLSAFLKKSYEKRSFLIVWKEKNDFNRRKLKF